MIFILSLKPFHQLYIKRSQQEIIRRKQSKTSFQILYPSHISKGNKNFMRKAEKKSIIERYEASTPTKLNVGMLDGINLALYPKERTHYLAYALQYRLEPPSVQSMDRSETKNQKKMLSHQTASTVRRVPASAMRRKIRVSFYLPNKFGSKPVTSFGRNGLGARVTAIRNRPRNVPFQMKPISLPKELIRNNRGKRLPKPLSKAFKIYSPEQLILKAQRARFRQVIEKYRVSHPGIPTTKTTPLYFIKKKASQHRRRQQKHKLIQDNRAALVEIFGDAVFKRGWPISRKEIKLALGIKEEDHDRHISLGQFMNMAEKRSKSKMQSSVDRVKNRLPPKHNEVSRMVRVGPPSASTDQKQTLPSFQKKHILDSSEFPSLLNR